MGSIIHKLDLDLKALEKAMDDAGVIEINGNEVNAAVAFVEADVRVGEHYSGVLLYLPGVAISDVLNEPAEAERVYYANLAKENLS